MSKSPSNNKESLRHSLSHILMQAVRRLYPNAQPGVGPAIENGFYHDFATNATLSENDLSKIENEMRKIITENLEIKKFAMPIDHGIKKLQELKYDYTAELAQELKEQGENEISFYEQGEFINMCKGPHLSKTGEVSAAAFKLTKIAGAYWRGDEKNAMLTRIYGVAFESKEELEKYLKQMAEAEKRDHRKLGKELDLFSFHNEGPGFSFWHPKGLILRELIIDYWRCQHKKAGYKEISTPIILNESLWQTSKHMENYKENMYFTEIDEQNFAIKPMNCPGGLLYYKEKPHSYKELPMRVSELGLVHRHEMAGVLHGLFRVRAFTQDDAHIYCTKDQIEDELKCVINLTQKIYQKFDFRNYHIELSTRPEKYTGDIKMWEQAETTLEKVLKDLNLKYEINAGDGAFYGPKIDFHIKDSIGRTWQCGTLQLDFAQPKNFKLEFIDKNDHAQRPVMLHRTIYGSLERFIGILTEHFAGAFPLWLAPVQAIILPVSEKFVESAKKLKNELCRENEARVEIDDSDQTVGYKIRTASKQKIPYMLVIGEKELPKDGKWNNDIELAVKKRGEDEVYKEKLGELRKEFSSPKS